MSDTHGSSSMASVAIDQPLSPEGAARSNRMLSDLQSEMRRTHASRRTRKTLALNAVALIGIIGVVAIVNRPSSRSTTTTSDGIARSAPAAEQPDEQPGEQPAASAPTFVITRESTPSDLMDKYAVRTPPTTAESLTDAELLAALASIDRPAGLVRTGDRVWLTREVADAPRIGGARGVGLESNSS